MTRILFMCAVLHLSAVLTAQVAINNDGTPPSTSAMLEIKSDNKGFLPPRMTWKQISAIPSPVSGLVVYDKGIRSLRMYNGNEWVVLGIKEFELTDPPGAFSSITSVTGNGTGSGTDILISANKTIYVAGYYTGSLEISGSILPPAVGSSDLFIAAFDSVSALLWIKVISGSMYEYIGDMEFDQSGNIIVTGSIAGTVDLDPGPGTDIHSSTGTDIFFAKYNTNGNLIWGKHMGGIGDEAGQAILSDPSGNIYVAGFFNNLADFDPGAGTANLTPAGSTDVFLARYDNNGNWVWSNRMGNTSFENANDLEWVSGTILFGGNFNGTVDFDPSVAVTNLVSAGGTDVFFARYDVGGGFLSAKKIGGTLSEQLYDITADASGNYWALGLFEGTCDMDPDAGVVNLISTTDDKTYFAKYQASGALLLAKAIGSNGTTEGPAELMLDLAGNVYICGYFAGSAGQVDFDPNAGTVNLVSLGSYDWYIAKYSPTGTFIWVADMGGTNYDVCNAFSVTPDGKFIVTTGYLWSTAYKAFNGERIFNSTQFFVARYEE